jgi:hypothetical protein
MYLPKSTSFVPAGMDLGVKLLRLVWEKVDTFNIRVEIRDLPLKFPWENDGWLMIMLENSGYLVDKLIYLNRVLCHQQVIFIQISLMQAAER